MKRSDIEVGTEYKMRFDSRNWGVRTNLKVKVLSKGPEDTYESTPHGYLRRRGPRVIRGIRIKALAAAKDWPTGVDGKKGIDHISKGYEMVVPAKLIICSWEDHLAEEKAMKEMEDRLAKKLEEETNAAETIIAFLSNHDIEARLKSDYEITRAISGRRGSYDANDLIKIESKPSEILDAFQVSQVAHSE